MSAPAPIRPSERSFAPDLARGAMLLFIAIANVPGYFYGRTFTDIGLMADASLLDRWVEAAELIFITDRSRPMFAVLYGFGIAIMVDRALKRSVPKRRIAGLLTKRGLWLIVFGVIHAALLWEGDILASYGITGLLALTFVFLRDRWVIVAGAVSMAWLTLALGFMAARGVYLNEDWGQFISTGTIPGRDYLTTMGDGIYTSFLLMGLSVAGLAYVPLVAVGVMMLRRGWLENPGAHVRGLRWTAGVGISVAAVAGLPLAVMTFGWWDPGPGVASALHAVTILAGMLGGCGYVALFALIAHSWQSRRAARGLEGLGALSVFSHVGQRSLTSYLAQSVIFAPVLSAWGLGLADGMGYGVGFGVAVLGWALTLVLAWLMARAGNRGPFETLLRRLIYGRRHSRT